MTETRTCKDCHFFIPAPNITEPRLKELGISRGFRTCGVARTSLEGQSNHLCINSDKFTNPPKPQLSIEVDNCQSCLHTILVYLESHKPSPRADQPLPTQSARVPACGAEFLDVLQNGGACVQPKKYHTLTE